MSDIKCYLMICDVRRRADNNFFPMIHKKINKLVSIIQFKYFHA